MLFTLGFLLDSLEPGTDGFLAEPRLAGLLADSGRPYCLENYIKIYF